MTRSLSPKLLQRIRKLARLPDDARQSQYAISVTRLTVLKRLCEEPDVANRFVTYLARKVLRHARQGKGRTSRPKGASDLAHRQMMSEAVRGMQAWLRRPTGERRQALEDLWRRMEAQQNRYRNVPWGAARIITDWDLFLVEQALRCLLHAHEAGPWAYQMARDYAERYDPRRGTGLTPSSAPLLQDIADFWMREAGVTERQLAAPVGDGRKKQSGRAARAGRASATTSRRPVHFTHRQGQFLAFILLYRKLHRQAPAELDLVRFFRVTPPSVHGMIVKLEELQLVTREPGVPRSLRVAVPDSQVPALEGVEGPPW